MKLQEAYDKIQAEVDNPRQYSHNIVSITLRQVRDAFGRTAANEIVADLDLDGEFGISEEGESDA